MLKIKSHHFSCFWIALGFLAVSLRLVLPATFFEKFYSRGLFLQIRETLDSLVIHSPVALVYFFVTALLIYLLIRSIFFFRRKAPVRQKLWRFFFKTASFSGALIFFFLLLWGYNYDRISVEKQLSLEPKPLDLDQIKKELDYHTSIITGLRAGITEVNDLGKILPLHDSVAKLDLTGLMRFSLKKVLADNGFPTVGEVQIRDLKPDGVLLRFGSSGVYFPFSGEGHVDAALHPLQKPFVIAHEMAHGYGFTDEGVCNFWAYLACIHSDNLFIRYVGHLNYWRYLATTYRFAKPEEYQKFRETLSPEIQADLNTINENLNRFPDWFPGIRDFIYDHFLKAQGIEDGIENYDRVIPLVTAWWEKMKR